MPSFKYRVIHKDGTIEQCESDAGSVELLHREFEAKGAFLEKVKEVKPHRWRPVRKKNVSSKQIYLFVHEFVSLLKAGVTIPESLQYLANRPSQPNFARILQDIRQKVVNGQSLSSSMDSYPGVFDRMIVNAVMIGEKNGQLVNSLNSYLSYLKIRIEIIQKIRGALVYPIFLSIILIVAVGILFFFVMPRFTTMYAEFGAELPYPTQLLMAIVDNSHVIIPLVLALLLFTVMGVKYWISSGTGKLYLDRLSLSLPGVSNVTVPFSISSSASALATLLSVGMPLVEALKATAKSNTNDFLASKLNQAAQRLAEGAGFAETVKELEIMDDSALTMIRAGEKSGQLVPILREISSFNTDKLNNAIERQLTLIEPLIMLIMGIVVGGIIFIMYLPIFSIAEVIK